MSRDCFRAPCHSQELPSPKPSVFNRVERSEQAAEPLLQLRNLRQCGLVSRSLSIILSLVAKHPVDRVERGLLVVDLYIVNLPSPSPSATPAPLRCRLRRLCGASIACRYSANRHSNVLNGKVLRVAFPGDSSSGYTIKTLASGKKDGSVVEMMRRIAMGNNFTWMVQAVSNFSKAKFSSSFSACVHEVAIGGVDMCIGSETPFCFVPCV